MDHIAHLGILAQTPIHFGGWQFFGSETLVDLIAAGMGIWPAALISFAVGFTFRILALYRGWEEPLAEEPAGVHVHADKRPLLGRKLHNKSTQEMRDLGLVVENGQSSQRQ